MIVLETAAQQPLDKADNELGRQFELLGSQQEIPGRILFAAHESAPKEVGT